MADSILHSNDIRVGQIFTPLKWAEWLIDRWSVFDAWLAGASVCDPTAGEGVFALALFSIAKQRGVELSPELISRLTLIDVDASRLGVFKDHAVKEYGVDFPSCQLLVRDVVLDPPDVEYDLLIGNPPWLNFTELRSFYKDVLKPYFVSEGLVPDKKQVLLGGARVDVAALVLKVVLGRLLKKGGTGCFYLPLSLFTGDDAHKGFRDYVANSRSFAVDEVYEFTSTKVFEKISTSYCCARFMLDEKQRFPVKYFRETGEEWVEYSASPLRISDDPWRVIPDGADASVDMSIDVKLKTNQKPRQGANTCGANAVFVFENKPDFLPEEFLFPLATKEIWNAQDITPNKWILLPYNVETGRALSWSRISEYNDLKEYLERFKSELKERKGVLIRAAIGKGEWWSLLGVGPYSFAPYKVIWEAYGRKDFQPIVLDSDAGQSWQGNQAMHAFIPSWDKADAERICSDLKHPGILDLLKQLNGEGKCNWAQPGKIKKILSLNND